MLVVCVNDKIFHLKKIKKKNIRFDHMFRVKSVPLIKMNYILDHVDAIKCGVLFLQLRRKKER